MSKLLRAKLPCPVKGCGSSDAYHEYENGGYCFSCKTFIRKEGDTDEYTVEYLPWKGITRETMEKFNTLTKIDAEGRPIALGFPYTPDAILVREFPKNYFWHGKNIQDATLFGMDRFGPGSSKFVAICEGAHKAMATHQILGYPAVSVRGSSSAKKDCSNEKAWKYINSFEKIYLCFDADKPGQDAAEAVAPLFDFNKVYHVKFQEHNDPTDYCEAHAEAEFKRVWWNARRFIPAGIDATFSDFDSIIDKDEHKRGVELPYPTLNEQTYGLRTGEIFLVSGLEGMGKTEIIRSFEKAVLEKTEDNLAIIHLEESKARNLKGLAGLKLKTPVHLPDTPVSKEEIKSAYRDLIKRDERVHLYSHFDSSDPDVILDTIRFLVNACGCRYVFLDHITACVAGLRDEDKRQLLDYISDRLDKMVTGMDFALVMISHENDHGQTRDSRYISKVAHTWLHIGRNVTSEAEEERNTLYLTLNKNRFGSKTGPAGQLVFDPSSFTLSEKGVLPCLN